MKHISLRMHSLGPLCWVLPVIYAVLAFCFSSVRCPRYALGVDPQYAYLLSALNFATGAASRFNDSPGITVRVLGAATMRLLHPVLSGADIVTEVLTNPELYLHALNAEIILLYTLLLVALGLWTLRVTGDVVLALGVQMTPLYVMRHYVFAMGEARAEPVILCGALLVGVVAVWSLPPRECGWPHALAYGFAFGFGIATKLSFAPLAVMPLIALKQWKTKAAYVVFLLLGWLVCFAPILRVYPVLATIKMWLLHTSTYGYGERAVFGPRFAASVRALIAAEPVFFLILATGAGVWLVSCVRWLTNRRLELPLSLLGGLIVGQVVQAFFVARTSMVNYLLPSLGLAGITLMVSAVCVKACFGAWRRIGACIAWAGVAAMTGYAGWRNVPIAREVFHIKAVQQAEVQSFIKDCDRLFADHQRILCYYAPYVEYALWAGNLSADGRYTKLLRELYPNALFYGWESGSPRLTTWTGELRWEELGMMTPRALFVGESPYVDEAARRAGVPVRNVIRTPSFAAYAADLSAFGALAADERWKAVIQRGAAANAVLAEAVLRVPFHDASITQGPSSVTLPSGLSVWQPAGVNAATRFEGGYYRSTPGSSLVWQPGAALTNEDITVAITLKGCIGSTSQVPYGQGVGSSPSNSPWFIILHPGNRMAEFVMQFWRADGGCEEMRIPYRWPPNFEQVWHTFAATYDAATQQLLCYVDGRLVGSARPTQQARRNCLAVPVTIGSLMADAYGYKGCIAEAYLWTRALSSNEVAQCFTLAR